MITRIWIALAYTLATLTTFLGAPAHAQSAADVLETLVGQTNKPLVILFDPSIESQSALVVEEGSLRAFLVSSSSQYCEILGDRLPDYVESWISGRVTSVNDLRGPARALASALVQAATQGCNAARRVCLSGNVQCVTVIMSSDRIGGAMVIDDHATIPISRLDPSLTSQGTNLNRTADMLRRIYERPCRNLNINQVKLEGVGIHGVLLSAGDEWMASGGDGNAGNCRDLLHPTEARDFLLDSQQSRFILRSSVRSISQYQFDEIYLTQFFAEAAWNDWLRISPTIIFWVGD